MDEVQAFVNALCPLGVAALLGGTLGLEREIHHRWAGLRTHILVAVGAALFMLSGDSLAQHSPDAPTRIIQGIAAGIGFIGAGTILKLTERQQVKGLTTASSLWSAAAVGTAAGLRLYGLAVCGTLFGLAALTLLGLLERRLEKKNEPGE